MQATPTRTLIVSSDPQNVRRRGTAFNGATAIAIEAERLLAIFEARTTALEKGLDKALGKSKSTFKGIEDGAKKAEDVLVRIGSRGMPGLDKAEQGINRTRGSVQSLQFQLNDIATQLASGTSPFTVMAQQGGQVAQSFAGVSSVMGGLRLLGAAALNPITLATIAFTGAAAIATSYFRDTEKTAEEANKKLQDHKRAIKEALDAWNGAPPPELKAYADELDRLDELAKKQAGFEQFIAAKSEPLKAAAENATAAFDDLYSRLEARNVDARILSDLKRDFDQMKTAIDSGKASVQDLLPLFTRLQELEAQIGTTKGFDALKKQVQDLIPLLERVNANIGESQRGLAALKSGYPPDVYGDRNQGFYPTINLPDTAPAPQNLGVDDVFPGNIRTTEPKAFLQTRAVTERIAQRIEAIDERFAADLAKVLAQFPELRVVSARRTTEEQKAIYDSGVRPAARPGNSLHERGLAVDLGLVGGGEPSRELLNRLYAAAREAGIEFPVRGDPFHAQPIGASGRGTEFGSAGTRTRTPADLFQGDMEDIQRRIDLLNAETEARATLNPKVDDYGFAVEKARIQQQLLNDASEAGVAITPELATKIDTLATNFARASSEAKQLEANQQAAAQASQQLGQIANTALSGLANALADGKLEGKELLGIVIQIAQQLLTMPRPGGFFGGMGGGFGGGGLLGGFLIPGILHGGGVAGTDGYGHGRAFPTSTFSSARRYHRGTLGAGEIPAVLKRGEIVLPRGAQAAGEPQTVTLRVLGEEGPMFRPTIQAESRGVAVKVVRQGIGEYDRDLNRSFGRRMAVGQAKQL
jgi:hypothetical protein